MVCHGEVAVVQMLSSEFGSGVGTELMAAKALLVGMVRSRLSLGSIAGEGRRLCGVWFWVLEPQLSLLLRLLFPLLLFWL